MPCAAVLGISLFLMVDRGIAQNAPEHNPMPTPLLGSWASDCGSDLPVRLDIRSDRAEVVGRSGTSTCRVAGHRALGAVRWYVDFGCKDGSLLQLDLYLVSRNSLLVARRPLGEACSYRRLDQKG